MGQKLMTKGELLNQRVWKLFQKAGFATKPSDKSSEEHNVLLSAKKPRPVDLYAEDKKLKIKIIGSNKSGTNVKPFSGHITDYNELGKKEKASTVLFVVTTKEVGEADRELISERKMVLWGQRELDYYDALADALGPFAKYEIIRALNLKTDEEKDTHHVLAIRLHQPSDEGGREMYMLTTTAGGPPPVASIANLTIGKSVGQFVNGNSSQRKFLLVSQYRSYADLVHIIN